MICPKIGDSSNHAAFFMDKAVLIQKIQSYRTTFEEEALFRHRFLSLLRNFHNCYQRSLSTGHITASAWVIDAQAAQVLFIHHKKLNRWLQPGGHADGDENVIYVAIREAEEETGLTSLSMLNSNIFDLDIHLIPQFKDVKAHLHFDIRFLFLANSSLPLVLNHESNEVRWIPIDQIDNYVYNNRSIHRMILKSKLIFK